MTKAERRAHLEAVIASARLRGMPRDAGFALAAQGIHYDRNLFIGYLKLHHRVAALRLSLMRETVAGDRHPDEYDGEEHDEYLTRWMRK